MPLSKSTVSKHTYRKLDTVYISRFLEPAIITTLLGGLAYFFGRGYSSGYYSRFGILSSILDQSPVDYIFKGATVGMMPMIVFLLYLLGVKYLRSHLLHPFLANLPILLPAIVFLGFMTYFPISNSFYILLLSGLLINVLLYFYLSLRRQSVETIYNKGLVERSIGIVVLIVVFYAIFALLGFRSAGQEIERQVATTRIEFKWKNTPPPELVNKELDLVVQSSGKYYVVPFENPAPQRPKVYIIYDTDIEYAITQTTIP